MNPPALTAPLGTRCVQCGYLLERIDVDSPCPECGMPVGDSLKPTRLELLPPSRLTAVTLGAGLFALGEVLAAARLVVGLAFALIGYSGTSVLLNALWAPLLSTAYLLYAEWLAAALLSCSVKVGDRRVWNGVRLIMAGLLLGRFLELCLASGQFGVHFASDMGNGWIWRLALRFVVTIQLIRIAKAGLWRAVTWLGPLAIIFILLPTLSLFTARTLRLGWAMSLDDNSGSAFAYVLFALMYIPQIMLSVGTFRLLRPLLARTDYRYVHPSTIDAA